MAYEFQKLSDVTLAETATDTANVLVEDGGEIKRVPKSEVGGAGGYVVTLTADNFSVNPISQTYYQFTCTDNYDPIYEVLMAGGSVWVDGTITGLAPGANIVCLNATGWVLSPMGLMLMFVFTLNGNVATADCTFTNGSHHTVA